MLDLKEKMLNMSETILQMKVYPQLQYYQLLTFLQADKLRLQQDPVAARLDELRFQEKVLAKLECVIFPSINSHISIADCCR